ncbi:MAG: hypothetical protein ACTSXK_11305, partial [Promethearchaeota archaeon]
MKWFKHITDSLEDPDIIGAMSRFGSDAYVVFFGILEMMGREFNEKTPAENTFDVAFIKRKIPISWKKIEKILDFYAKRKRFFVEYNNVDGANVVTIKCPKFKELTDNWTKAKLRSNYEVASKKLSTKIKIKDKDKDIEEEIEKDNYKFASKKQIYIKSDDPKLDKFINEQVDFYIERA